MSTWIKLLPLELDSLKDSDIIEPDAELECGDKVVGVMPDSAKKLWTLAKLFEKECDSAILARKYCTDKSGKHEFEAKAHQYSAKSQFLKMALWISLREEFDLWHENVKVCNGFKVVTYEQVEDESPFRFFRLG